MSRRLPDPPELPEAARPQWRPWYGFAAFVVGLVALSGLAFFALPLLVLVELGTLPDNAGLFGLVLIQDATWLGGAVALGRIKAPVRGWHLGLRGARAKRALVVATVATITMLAFELGYLELVETGEGNTEELAEGQGALAGFAISLAVIVVAPVFEEIFFRGFLYRALRNRLRVWSAALIDGAFFGVLHFQGFGAIEILPVIALFGVLTCVVYEWTETIFATIAIHAVFNTVATVGTDVGIAIPLGVGVAVLIGCVAVPARLPASPSPFPSARA